MKAPIRIVAATDLSAPARHAVERAFHLAKQSGGELHILHALELDTLDSLKELIGASLSSTKDALDADARQRLMQLTGDLTRKHGFNAQWRVVPGNPRTAVMSEAEVLDAGMLVLGARGASFLRRTMLGSTSTRLLRKSIRRPVLVVKRPPYEGYRNVLVAVDFSPVSLHLIQAAKQWAARAELFLCHAFELPFEGMLWRAGIDKEQIAPLIGGEIAKRRKQLFELAAAAGLGSSDYSMRVVHGDPNQHIIAMEQEYDIDLIVVGKHGTNVTEELLLGSVTKHVLTEAQADVMVIADPRPSELDAP